MTKYELTDLHYFPLREIVKPEMEMSKVRVVVHPRSPILRDLESGGLSLDLVRDDGILVLTNLKPSSV